MRLEKKMHVMPWIKSCAIMATGIIMMMSDCYGFGKGSWTAIDPSSTINFVQVAVGNEKTVVARDKNGDTYQLLAGSWKPLGGGKARWIAAGSDGAIFAVGKETRKLYRRAGEEWQQVAGIDALSRIFVLDQDHMWGTLRTKQGVDVWQFQNGTWARPLGADGKTPAAHWKNIAVAPGVFLVTDLQGNVMMRSTKIAPTQAVVVKKAVAKKKTAKKKRASKKASKKKTVKKSSKKKTGKKKATKKKSAQKKNKAKKTSKKKSKATKKKKSAAKKTKSKKKAASTKGAKKSAKKKMSKKKSSKKKASKKKKAASTMSLV